MKTIVISGSENVILDFLHDCEKQIVNRLETTITEIPGNSKDDEGFYLKFEVDSVISEYDDGHLLYNVQET